MPAKQRAHRKADTVLETGQVIFVPRFHIESGRTVLSRAEIVRVGRKWLFIRFENGQQGKLLRKEYDAPPTDYHPPDAPCSGGCLPPQVPAL